MQGSSGNRRESISTDRVIPNFPLSEKAGSRRSSLKSMVRFPWDTCKDTQSPESKALLWESPVEYTNSGSFIRTTVTDFGTDCIDEEDEESRTPETTSTSNIASATSSSAFGGGSSSHRKTFVVNVEVNNAGDGKEFTSSSAPNSASGRKGMKGFELPSTSKGRASATGDRDVSSTHSHSAPASPKPSKKGNESNISICSAIRDFIIHSIRS